jgi:hypothetical protein
LPDVASSRPVAGCTTAPRRAQIAESLAAQVLGVMIAWRSEHSELNTPARAPSARRMVTTLP